MSSMNNYNGCHYEESISEQIGNDGVETTTKFNVKEGNASGNNETGGSESPPRIDVDESGYETSGSSVYEVLSDDDEYNNCVENHTTNNEIK
jgi:hypothetical protein